MVIKYSIYNYVNKFEARSLFSTSHLKIGIITKSVSFFYKQHFFLENQRKKLKSNMNFASRAIWHTIVFKVSAFQGGGIPVFKPKTD